MNKETTTVTETEERALPCFVRHEDAGGQCFEPQAVQVHGLGFCEAHGFEARIGAALEEYQDAEWYFERFRSPHVPKQSDGIERTLERALDQLRKEGPSDEDYDLALITAYPQIPEAARRRVVNWQQDEMPGEMGVLDTLFDELRVLHKLLRVADEGRIRAWLVEVLDQERQSLAAQAAYVLRNPDPPEPDDG